MLMNSIGLFYHKRHQHLIFQVRETAIYAVYWREKVRNNFPGNMAVSFIVANSFPRNMVLIWSQL